MLAVTHLGPPCAPRYPGPGVLRLVIGPPGRAYRPLVVHRLSLSLSLSVYSFSYITTNTILYLISPFSPIPVTHRITQNIVHEFWWLFGGVGCETKNNGLLDFWWRSGSRCGHRNFYKEFYHCMIGAIIRILSITQESCRRILTIFWEEDSRSRSRSRNFKRNFYHWRMRGIVRSMQPK